MRYTYLLFYGLLVTCFLEAQQPTIQVLESGKRISIRGLSVVNKRVIWASGSSGSVARSIDGGKSFEWIKVPGYEKNDFRDIEAFDERTAIIMGITAPAVILKTKDGGQNWIKVFEDTSKSAFLDAMNFSPDGKNGMVVGDPLEKTSYPYLLFTKDRGDNWEKILNDHNGIRLDEGEAFFASSGTNLAITENIPWWVLVSGGKSSKAYVLYKDQQNQWKYHSNGTLLPIMQGKESTGANSVAMQHSIGNSYATVIVGGDFAKDTIASNNCVLLNMHGSLLNIKKPQTPPHGYRSCVTYLSKKKLLTCGTSGVDISGDGGNNWELISKESFHVCQKAKKGTAVFLAGSNGKIARLIFH